MTGKYDRLYGTTPDALGAQDPGIAAWIARLPAAPLRVLDLGAGQGRDALPLARAGHRVVALDSAASGLRQIAAVAAAEDLPVTTLVGDLEDVLPDTPVDLLLANRTLHMIRDPARREAAFRRALARIAPGGYLILADERRNLPGLRACLEPATAWDILASTPARLFCHRRDQERKSSGFNPCRASLS